MSMCQLWEIQQAPIYLLIAKSKCHPLFGDTEVLYQHRDQTVRELVEAYFIKEHNDKCISKSSIILHGKEQALIGTMFV